MVASFSRVLVLSWYSFFQLDVDFCISMLLPATVFFFFFNDTATTEIYTLSLHDALPICEVMMVAGLEKPVRVRFKRVDPGYFRSEEHTSELQSHLNLVCRLLLEKKKNNNM